MTSPSNDSVGPAPSNEVNLTPIEPWTWPFAGNGAHLEEVRPIPFDHQHGCFVGYLSNRLILSDADREALWQLHPSEFPMILMHGKLIPVPRWQQAYGADYHYSRQVSKALPIPPLLTPLYAWVRDAIDSRLNGVFVNWYDADLDHYIGPHRDSTKFMCPGAPIVMVSFGASRIMRFAKWKGTERYAFDVHDGTVCRLPFDTNLAWTHEILPRKRDAGRRISVTFRAFESGILDNNNATSGR